MLESSNNPFAVVVMAHLRTRETRIKDEERLKFKIFLTKALYRSGWTKQQIIDLYRFIDWIMKLPDDLEKAYHHELTKYEEEIKMQYVTTAERIGIEKGKTEEKRETAKKLLKLDALPEEQIALVTELSVEEIRQLRQELEDSSD